MIACFLSIFFAASIPVLANAAPAASPLSYAFGSVNAAQPAPIVHVFTVRNTTDESVTIDKIQPTCGCTTAVLGNGAKVELPAALAPGASVDISVSIDPGHLSPGNVDKFVNVMVKEQPEVFASLEMTGSLIAGATYSPNALDFGKIPYGKGAEIPLTVTLDPYMADPKLHAHVITTQAGVEVKELDSDSKDVPKTGAITQHYTVRVLPDARLGTFNGVVTMLSDDGHGGQRQVSLPAPVTGEVIGNVKADPEMIAFAMVTAGKVSTQEVLLRGVSESDIPRIKVLAAGESLSAKVVPSGKNDPQPSVRLVASIAKTAHPGSMGGEIIVSFPDGAELLLPVNAYIVAGK